MTQTSFSTCRRGCRDCNPFMPLMVPFEPHRRDGERTVAVPDGVFVGPA